eukprot:260719-Chlamydomonas_euryale.AAC.3
MQSMKAYVDLIFPEGARRVVPTAPACSYPPHLQPHACQPQRVKGPPPHPHACSPKPPTCPAKLLSPTPASSSASADSHPFCLPATPRTHTLKPPTCPAKLLSPTPASSSASAGPGTTPGTIPAAIGAAALTSDTV